MLDLSWQDAIVMIRLAGIGNCHHAENCLPRAG